jgi:energy-coupling factor transporter ATP-binding protein EcfA2
MGAWILAWVDRSAWRDPIAADPAAAEQLGEALKALFRHDRLDGFGKLQADYQDVGRHDVDYVASHETRLVIWSDGELVEWPASGRSDVTDFLAAPQDSGFSGPILLFGIDWDDVDKRSAIEVGEAVATLISGGTPADSLGGLTLRTFAEVASDDTAWFAWYGNALLRTDKLSASHRHTIAQTLGGRRHLSTPDTPLRLVHVSMRDPRYAVEIELPMEPSTLMVLLGRNGAGKTTILEDLAIALGQAGGITSPDELRKSFASLSRRRADHLNLYTKVTLRAENQDAAPQLFQRLLFLLAYGPTSPPFGFRNLMPKGGEVWDDLSAIDDPKAIDPRHLIDELDLETLRAAFVDAIVRSVPNCDDQVEEALRTIIEAYLSGTDVVLSTEGLVHGTVGYQPPPADSIAAIANSISFDRYKQLFVGLEASHYAYDALRWAGTTFDEWKGGPAEGMSAVHPQWGQLGGARTESPWAELHDDILRRVRESLPAVVAFDPRPGDGGIEASVEEILIDFLLNGPFNQPGYHNDTDVHLFANPLAAKAAKLIVTHLAARATELLPPFAREAGSIRISVAPSEEWHRRRIHVEIDSDGKLSPLAASASGVASWGIACIRLAAAQLRASRWVAGNQDEPTTTGAGTFAKMVPQAPTLYPLLYLADEPEAHLHHTAIKEVVDVCDSLARNSTGGCIVATHALEFLGRPDMVTAPLLVYNFAIRPVTPGLPELRSRAQHLGITPAMVLNSARAVLCVEGPSDAIVLDAFVGTELDRSYVHTLKLYGMNKLADRLPELDLIYSLDIPVYLLLDHTRASTLDNLLKGEHVSDVHKEEWELNRLAQALRRPRQATVIEMAETDIVQTIPNKAMSLVLKRLKKAAWPGWKEANAAIEQKVADTRHRRTHGKPFYGFKNGFRDVVGAPVNQVINALADVNLEGINAPVLTRVVKSLTADLESGEFRNQTEPLRVLSQ